MQYQHDSAEVSNIIRRTKATQDRYVSENDWSNALTNLATERPSEVCIHDGLPMRTETVQFMNELLKLHPEYKFGVTTHCETKWIGVDLFEDVWVYREHDKYALGRIGYVNMSAAHKRDLNPKDAYCVYSRVISNEKYRDHRWQYHSQASKKLAKGVELADKFLRIYSPMEVATLTAYSFGIKMKSLGDKSRKSRYDAVNDLQIQDDRWVIEFRHIMDAGYEFHHPSLKSLVDNYLTKHAEYLEYKMRRINGWNIQTAQPMYGEDEQYVHVTPFADFHKDVEGTPCVGKRIKLSALPPSVIGKLASLMLLTDGKYVDSIGYRVNEDNFWVMTDEILEVL